MKWFRHNFYSLLFQTTVSVIYLLQVTLIPILHGSGHGHGLEEGHVLEVCANHKDYGILEFRCDESCSDPEHHHAPSSHDSEDCVICKGISTGLTPNLLCIQKNICIELEFIHCGTDKYYPRHIGRCNPCRAPPSRPLRT